MHATTPARVRAVGMLLFEAAFLGFLIWRRIGRDPVLSPRIQSLVSRLGSL